MSQSHGASLDDDRLRRLLDVGRSLVAELNLDALLDHVLEVARELTGARYAAIGVLDERGSGLERFITSGIDDDQKRIIGDLPLGRGVLGVLIDEPHALRLTDVNRHPKSFGFPPGHPPMTTFLGVPIRVRGAVFGNLYLTDRAEGEFTGADEEAIEVLADWAAIAIDNARSYERESRRRGELEVALQGLEATLDIGRAIGTEIDRERVLELIVKRARALLDARLVLIVLTDESGEQLVVSAAAGEVADDTIGDTVPLMGSVSGEVFRTQRPQRLADVSSRLHFSMGRLEVKTGLFMPLVYRSRSLGVLCAFDRGSGEEFTGDDERLLEGFATSAALAVATAQSVAEAGLRRSLEASERERTRWARELHDETLQELAGLNVMLAAARREVPEAAPLIAEAISQVAVTITGLRSLITDLRPAALDQYGLAAALEALVGRMRATSGVDIVADVAIEERLEEEIESTVYRLVQEALNNALHHGAPESVSITVQASERDISVEIRDDGRGFDPAHRHDGYGLVGMRERAALVGAVIEISSSSGAGTVVSARVPARRRSHGVRALREAG